MMLDIVPLDHEYLHTLLQGAAPSLGAELHRSYFSPGSVALCMLNDGAPVFAGGIVNLGWHRGEVWILPTPFFKRHIKTCFKHMRDSLLSLGRTGGFVRLQATCVYGQPGKWLRVFGFEYEGTMKKFGPGGETCDLYARILEASQ